MKPPFLLSSSSVMIIFISGSLLLSGCKSSSVTGNNKDAAKWFQNQEWLNGLNLKPHPSINETEFSRQYHLNKVWWDRAFEFLKTNDLNNLKPGNYIVDTGNVIAMVVEVNPKDKDLVNWEAHRNFNDLQYIITGKARMGITALSDPEAKVTQPYSPKSDTETFSDDGGKYYTAEPGTFFIFSPKEIHRPAFKLYGYDMIKKIVIKVRVPQG